MFLEFADVQKSPDAVLWKGVRAAILLARNLDVYCRLTLLTRVGIKGIATINGVGRSVCWARFNVCFREYGLIQGHLTVDIPMHNQHGVMRLVVQLLTHDATRTWDQTLRRLLDSYVLASCSCGSDYAHPRCFLSCPFHRILRRC